MEWKYTEIGNSPIFTERRRSNDSSGKRTKAGHSAVQCAMPSAHIPQEGCSVQDGRNTEMKIAMFGHKCIPSRSGGVEIVVQELSTRMAERGHQVTCYNRSGKSAQTQTQYGDVRLRAVPTVDFKGLAAVTSSFFASLACCVSDAKIVHIHADGPGAMCWLPRLFGKRVIVTIHGLDWKREKWKKPTENGRCPCP